MQHLGKGKYGKKGVAIIKTGRKKQHFFLVSEGFPEKRGSRLREVKGGIRVETGRREPNSKEYKLQNLGKRGK